MSKMKRYYRIVSGDIYDRLTGHYITVREIKCIGDMVYINPQTEEEKVIHIDDIELERKAR